MLGSPTFHRGSTGISYAMKSGRFSELLGKDHNSKHYLYQCRKLGYLPSDNGEHKEQMTQMMFLRKLITEYSYNLEKISWL